MLAHSFTFKINMESKNNVAFKNYNQINTFEFQNDQT